MTERTDAGPVNNDPDRQPREEDPLRGDESPPQEDAGRAQPLQGDVELNEPPPLLTDQFDHVFVINCAHRPDRLKDFFDDIGDKRLAAPTKITVYPAIIGDYTGHPAGWGGGNGAWGCLQSHRRLMEDLMHMRDDRQSMRWATALILEDDVVFREDALTTLANLLNNVPKDWGQIYLGGQNQKPVTRLSSSYVVQCHSVNRTHAYAINRHSIQAIYHHVSYMADYHSHKHIDHQLEFAHQRGDWKVYGPPKWICGQRAGSSNISGRLSEKDVFWD